MPKRKSYSVEEKLVVVARVQNGESQANVSRNNSVPQSTIRGWQLAFVSNVYCKKCFRILSA